MHWCSRVYGSMIITELVSFVFINNRNNPNSHINNWLSHQNYIQSSWLLQSQCYNVFSALIHAFSHLYNLVVLWFNLKYCEICLARALCWYNYSDLLYIFTHKLFFKYSVYPTVTQLNIRFLLKPFLSYQCVIFIPCAVVLT